MTSGYKKTDVNDVSAYVYIYTCTRVYRLLKNGPKKATLVVWSRQQSNLRCRPAVGCAVRNPVDDGVPVRRRQADGFHTLCFWM